MNIYSGVRSFPSSVGVVEGQQRSCGHVGGKARPRAMILSWQAHGGRVRSPVFLNILLGIGGFGERLGDSFQW